MLSQTQVFLFGIIGLQFINEEKLIMKKVISLLVVSSMVFALAACSDEKVEETTASTTAATEATTEATEGSAEEETTAATEAAATEETAASEETTTAAETSKESQDLRSTAESYIGKNCVDLENAIGECQSIHPEGSQADNGMYRGYLHYDGFEVEFESETEDYLDNGDLSGCTVIAVVDPLFD